MKKIILLLVASMTLTACSNGNVEFAPDTFSAADMCIVKVDNEKEKVCYGMERSEAEKVVGVGQQGRIGTMEYDFGMSISYRDDIVALIQLSKGSKGVYRTARGSQVDILKSDAKALYGEKYAIDEHERSLEYFYDTESKKFLGKVSVEQQDDANQMEKTHYVSFVFNENGYADFIYLFDRKMAMRLE